VNRYLCKQWSNIRSKIDCCNDCLDWNCVDEGRKWLCTRKKTFSISEKSYGQHVLECFTEIMQVCGLRVVSVPTVL